MNIFHSLKRKFHTRRRQQDSVLPAHTKPKDDQPDAMPSCVADWADNHPLQVDMDDFSTRLAQKIRDEFSPKYAWGGTFNNREAKLFYSLSPEDRVWVINSLYRRAHELKELSPSTCFLPIRQGDKGFYLGSRSNTEDERAEEEERRHADLLKSACTPSV